MAETTEDRAAARQAAKEKKAEAAQKLLRDTIAGLEEPDKTNASKIKAIVDRVAPQLIPKLMYGSPAWATPEGKTLLFFQERERFKARYGNFVFFGPAKLDDGTMWPTSWAVTELSAADEKLIEQLVRRAVGG